MRLARLLRLVPVLDGHETRGDRDYPCGCLCNYLVCDGQVCHGYLCDHPFDARVDAEGGHGSETGNYSAECFQNARTRAGRSNHRGFLQYGQSACSGLGRIPGGRHVHVRDSLNHGLDSVPVKTHGNQCFHCSRARDSYRAGCDRSCCAKVSLNWGFRVVFKCDHVCSSVIWNW